MPVFSLTAAVSFVAQAHFDNWMLQCSGTHVSSDITAPALFGVHRSTLIN